MRIMAIDYGDARIGIAVSDYSCSICGDAFTLKEWNMERAAATIVKEMNEREVTTIVLGLPKNMDGTEGERAQKSHDFAAVLTAHGACEIVLWDERRTTIDAHRILHTNGLKTKKHKAKVDAVAASLILEGYLGTL